MTCIFATGACRPPHPENTPTPIMHSKINDGARLPAGANIIPRSSVEAMANGNNVRDLRSPVAGRLRPDTVRVIEKCELPSPESTEGSKLHE